MRRTIGTLALALVVGLFGMAWGAEPAEACTTDGGGVYTCSQTNGASGSFGNAAYLNITVISTARMGQLYDFSNSEVLIENGAQITTQDNYPGVYTPNGTNSIVTNYGNVTAIRLAGDGNKITNHGIFRQTLGNPHSYTVAIEGTDSQLINESTGSITGRTAVRSTDAAVIENHGRIAGTTRAIDIQGSSAGDVSTIITNTGTIENTASGPAIRRQAGHDRRVSLSNFSQIIGDVSLLGPAYASVHNQENARIEGTVSLGSANDDFENEGLITGSVNMGAGDDKITNHLGATIKGGVSLSSGADTLTNAGTIEGTLTSGTGTSLITNTGSIGRMNLGNGDDEVTNETGATVVGNLGLGGGTDVLVNHGQIGGTVTSGAGASSTTNHSIIANFALGAGHDMVTNTEDGIITGDVGLGGGDDVLVNHGQIDGVVTSGTGTSNTTNHNTIASFALGAGDDTVTNKTGATIGGNVNMGTGTDTVTNAGVISGRVDLGGGSANDTNTLDNSGTIGQGVFGGDVKNIVDNVDGGEISGDITLGSADDEVTNKEGSIIRGNIALGDGNDILVNHGRIEGTVSAGDGQSDITNQNFIASIALGAGDDTVTNKTGATIGSNVNMGTGTDTVTNAGVISGRVDLGGGSANDTNTLDNSGTIGQGVLGGDVKNIVDNVDGGEISGDITLGSAGDEVTNKEGSIIGGNIALGDGNDILVNHGRIEGTVSAGDGESDITNENFIASVALGEGDDNVANKADAIIDGNVGLGDGDDTLTNDGRIEGTVTAGAGTSTITNAGFIDRIRLGAGNDTVANIGIVHGNVDLGNGDNTLNTSGTIGGNVITGTGEDRVNIVGDLQGSVSGGSGVDIVTVGSDAQVLGNVLLGAGDDQLILQNWDGSQILGTMDGGDGDDRLILEGGEGTLLTSGFRNFENVSVRDEGEWTISGNIPTSGGFLTSTLAGLWLEGDDNAVTYAVDSEIVVKANDGTGVFVEGDGNMFTNEGSVDAEGDRAVGIRVHGDENVLVNAADGSLTTQGDTANGIGVIGHGNELTNDGVIDVSDTSARGVNVFGDGNTVMNTAEGSIKVQGEGATGLVMVGADNVFTNEGSVEAIGDDMSAVIIGGSGNTVTNTENAKIAAEGDGVVGVNIQGAANSLDNAGVIEVRGTDEVAAVQVVSTDDNADANVITNTGTVRAESDNGKARGIVTTGDGKTQIHNELGALIEADIAIHAGGDGQYGITNDGTIRGDIVLGDGDHVVQNDGDIFGDIRLGDGNHDITNDGFLSGNIDLSESEGDHKVELVGGSLWDPGLIQLGTGDDELTYSTVANDMTDQHTLDGGDGDDTLILVDDGRLNLYNIVNFETLELRDAGTWQFHRDVSFRDAVTADEGHLILGNATEGGVDFGTGGLTIGSDARLSGTGTITGDVTIEGTVTPGYSFGTFNVNGNYTQASGSTYEAEMAIDGRRDLIHATGAATIANDTLLDITAEYGYYDPTDRWNVLQADGGVTGTYTNAEWDIDLLFLGPEATTEGDNVYIDLVHAGPSFESVAGTPNQKAVAAALDTAEAAGVGMNVVNMVLPALDIADARQAYDSLHGEIYAQHRWITMSSMQDFVAAANLGVTSNEEARSVWASAFKGIGTVKSEGEFMEAEHDHLGLVLGWTAWANDTWSLGMLGGFNNVNVSLADVASEGTASGQKFGAYGRYNNGLVGVNAQVVSGQDRFAVHRDMELLGNPLDDRTAKAEYDSNNLAVSLEGSLNYQVGEYALKPTLGLNWFSISRAGFTETGAGAAGLAVKADEYSMTQGVLGMTVVAPVPEDQTYTPEFRIAYVTNFGGFASEFDATFADAASVPFTIGGETPSDGGFFAGGSIRGETGKEGLSYELRYDGKFFGSATVHTFGGGLGYSF